MNDLYMAEVNRLKFIVDRDGVAGGIQFATQSFRQYKTTLKRERGRLIHPLAREFRVKFLISLLVLRHFLKSFGAYYGVSTQGKQIT